MCKATYRLTLALCEKNTILAQWGANAEDKSWVPRHKFKGSTFAAMERDIFRQGVALAILVHASAHYW